MRGSPMRPPALDVRQLAAHARRAVSDHQGCLAPEAVRLAEYAGATVVIWMSSASDVTVVTADLRRRGYAAGPGAPGRGGYTVVVTPAAAESVSVVAVQATGSVRRVSVWRNQGR
jgi:hypothetical protein